METRASSKERKLILLYSLYSLEKLIEWKQFSNLAFKLVYFCSLLAREIN
ncbi:hypothetical protein C789_950 [Microcystis aeruginosa FACHB-905 = DIANCHI905]|uniref:Uncharacterized protein n=1 Tax=Microcystis aeruginosa PCC 7806SL TaxID=1903187 RepID=A0AB33BYC8_MICA7|nr:hypothetical protein BH695_3772 [Microcystis aeruginosa PCC 7806SL]ELS49239.1 hypothetical protein C789_950 [Microcystis aeruginosa FACHB-905 = DIANCHI905]